MTENVNDIIEYIKANGISNEDWQKMYDVAVEFDKNRSEEEKEQELLNDIRKLDNLYKTSKHFQTWCSMIKAREDYQCALENFEIDYAKTHGGSYHPEWSDVPGEDIYIPCFTYDKIANRGNPYNFSSYRNDIILVRNDVDDIIVNEDSMGGSRAFAAFWAYNFNTIHMPEIIYDSQYTDKDYSPSYMADYDLDLKDCFFYKRRLLFDSTIWNCKELKKLYEKAISG